MSLKNLVKSKKGKGIKGPFNHSVGSGAALLLLRLVLQSGKDCPLLPGCPH